MRDLILYTRQKIYFYIKYAILLDVTVESPEHLPEALNPAIKLTVKISKKYIQYIHSILTWFYRYDDNTCVLNVWSLLKCKRKASEFIEKKLVYKTCLNKTCLRLFNTALLKCYDI